MKITPTPGVVCFSAQARQLSSTLIMPSGVDAPTDWIVVESGCDNYQPGDIIVPNLKHAGKVTLDKTEYFFIPSKEILAKVTR